MAPKRVLFDYVTLGLAIWGAVLATLKFGLDYLASRNRGRLLVECHVGFGVGISSGNQDKLIFKITNSGNTPVMAEYVGGYFRRKLNPFFILSTEPQGALPVMLSHGESVTVRTLNIADVEEPVKVLAVWDSLGNAHKISRGGMKNLQKELQLRQENARVVV